MRAGIDFVETASGTGRPWTDDLKICPLTGVGEATNLVYKEDGSRIEAYKSRDKKCLCIVDDTLLYGIFSGHNGVRVADFALQKMAADLLLGQLNGRSTDEAVKDVIRQAFHSVEKGYFDSIDADVATKTAIQLQLSVGGLSQYQISQEFGNILEKLDKINLELSVGSSVALALIHQSKLYIGNIGNCRALLCKTDEFDTLTVTQLSVDHNLYNEEEVLRLFRLGLEAQNFENCPLYSTRCIGNYIGKTGYKDCDFLSDASTEPVIFQPEIVGSIPITSACKFLVLMSGGLCRAMHDLYPGDTSRGNRILIQMIAEEFQTQSTLAGVAQSVVHRIVQLHHDAFMQQVDEGNPATFSNRDDITLLIRNFNYPLPNAFNNRKNSSRSYTSTTSTSSTTSSDATPTNQSYSAEMDCSMTGTNISVASSDRSENDNFPESEKRIKAYVDFSDYHRRVAEARKLGLLPPNIDFD
ncbi:TGF-beta-activated kinase 1 and MAP3K7-binding protein 1-like [Toxorhynchites rutilus septentrionalis]|uniref:TGF-beta-activated kinase 1 and MAP3K7-binding protein 1-like n=1 Tax=Toxorhynchites rutilus septentrionalis TaxID=329112 RepID=UPI0024792519|nr:TGF-beta-activated kinase 1 and MAP3K7-binding protein 1-like [Toxorhynchites rutilus septentrionalis]